MSGHVSNSRRKRLIRDTMEAFDVSRAEAVRMVNDAAGGPPVRAPHAVPPPEGDVPDPLEDTRPPSFWRRR